MDKALTFQIINGKAIAGEIRQELKTKVAGLKGNGIIPGLSIILVGNHPASEVYVRGKMKACKEVGIFVSLIRFENSVLEEEILEKISRLNEDPLFHGILVQLPLPAHISTSKIVEAITPNKDVDGFHPYNVGRFVIGHEAFLPCTPKGIMELLHRSNCSLAGKHAVVVGRSNIVGKPISLLLLQANCTVTICHSRTPQLSSYTRQADILIVAVGKEKLITGEDIKPGAIIIDVGMNRTTDGHLVGDVDFDDVAPLSSAITPVPGGVGPMTIAMLLSNTIRAAASEIEDELI